MVRSSTSLSSPSSWIGSSAASFIPQMTSVGTFTVGKARSSQSGRGTVTPGGGTTTREPRYQLSIALNAPGCDQSAIYCRFSASGIFDTSTCRAKVVSKNQSIALRLDHFLEARRSEGRDVLRRGALIGVFDQAFLEDHRMGRVDDREAGQPRVAAQCRRPRNRAAPVVADQREAARGSARRPARRCRRSAYRLCSPRRPAAGPNRRSRAGRA